jgi:hypothetical protein
MSMTPDAKRELSTTIQSLRSCLLDDLHAATNAAYRLAVRARDAALDEAAGKRRARLEAWVAEQIRAQSVGTTKDVEARTATDFRREAEKQAAYTLLNRLVILRLMEASGPTGEPLRAPTVVTGGWESRAYKDFRQIAPALVRGDETEGFAFLLQLVFEDLATELPGIYGSAGISDLIPIPAATMRHVVEELDKPALESCWTDDMTLGWVYQYWNDPEKEAIDARLNAGGKVEPYEIASKTQLFTERYMVDWLLQNSLGPMWLAMCRKHGWTADVEDDGTLQRLEQRRIDWRAKREAGEVAWTDLMPLHTEAERRWAYYVPQPIDEDAVEFAPLSVRDLKIFDPAVGSGHFLVVAFDLLLALYREEQRHRGEQADNSGWSDRAIVERILEHNLNGVDLDARAVQIAAAALWIKARQKCHAAHPARLNLVASNLRLASLSDDDPALVGLRLEVERETGIPAALTDTVIHALKGADHLGSLLKIDAAVDLAIEQHETAAAPISVPTQSSLLTGQASPQSRIAMAPDEAKVNLVERLEDFLARHTGGDDLGLRLRGEQLAAGVRFVRIVRERSYDLVVGNPPYLGIKKVPFAGYIKLHFAEARSDLFSAFVLRARGLAKPHGYVAFVTLRSWLFLEQFGAFRDTLLRAQSIRAVADLHFGAFSEIKDISVCLLVAQARLDPHASFVKPVPSERVVRDQFQKARNEAGLLCRFQSFVVDQRAFLEIPGTPTIYWWERSFLDEYLGTKKLANVAVVRQGMSTADNRRFLRAVWETHGRAPTIKRVQVAELRCLGTWVPYIMGAAGRTWLEPLADVIAWDRNGLENKVMQEHKFGSVSKHIRNERLFFVRGVAFTTIGSSFGARMHRYASICDATGRSVYAEDRAAIVCVLNSTRARFVLESLNPGVHFTVGDVERVPAYDISNPTEIINRVETAFAEHESHREPSVEYRYPGSSSWRYVQYWAQVAVDRPSGGPLPPYQPEHDAESSTDHLSFALGVVLGRFAANGEGILDPTESDLSHAMPAGIVFLDRTLDGGDLRDSLGHSAASALLKAWAKHGLVINAGRTNLREWLALNFFKDVHKDLYENRPIHWPLSSAQKTFVAWVNIHRFTEQTLHILLADHLNPTLNRIEGELNDLRNAREGADKKAARAAEKQYDRVLKARDELHAFIIDVEQCADRGALPPADSKCPPREQDARYDPDLDDGVLINAAALWPLLEPQWKDSKKWWKQLCEAKGKKDYDWSHLAMRYWPTRVDAKCQEDPSLGVAHGCFWRYHPDRAWAWELRLQDEIGPNFRIEEVPYRPGGRDIGDKGSGPHRETWLRDHPQEALAAVEKEAIRRMRRHSKNKELLSEMRILEEGLWSAVPDEVWEMELRVAKKQGAEFQLLAPDEPVARAAYVTAHPDRVQSRLAFMATLVRSDDWFGETADEDEEVPDDDAIEDEEAEAEP